MKIVKMSLVAALLVGSSAFAIENVKVSGDAKLFYSTQDNDGTAATGGVDSLFDKAASHGQAALSLGLTADLTDGVSAGTKMTALTTLGLENSLVGAGNVWEGTNGASDSYIVNEAWIAGTVGNTTGKAGRMELDTPLVFSEQWSIVANTFEAAVLVNQDIANTTLVAAYVGGSNSGNVGGQTGNGLANVIAPSNAATSDTTFSAFNEGAYTFGAINNSFEPLTAQAWYYDVDQAASGIKAYWLQADVALGGIMAGAQYSSNDVETGATSIDTNVYAVMLGYEMKDTFTAKVSYSKVSDETGANNNSAGGNLAGGNVAAQSKLYTEAWWNYGMVTNEDAKSYNVTIEAPVMGYDLGLYYTDVDQGTTDGDNDVTEFTASISKSFGALDASLVYINWELPTPNDATDDETTNALQVYLTYNF